MVLLSYRQAADLVGCSIEALQQAERLGHINRRKVSGRRGFLKDDMKRWLLSRAQQHREMAEQLSSMASKIPDRK